jgi:hypothetical protein
MQAHRTRGTGEGGPRAAEEGEPQLQHCEGAEDTDDGAEGEQGECIGNQGIFVGSGRLSDCSANVAMSI